MNPDFHLTPRSEPDALVEFVGGRADGTIATVRLREGERIAFPVYQGNGVFANQMYVRRGNRLVLATDVVAK